MVGFFAFLLDKSQEHVIIYTQGGNMKVENNKVWLYLDQALRKLQNVTHWTTSADEWHEDIIAAKESIKEALKKLEEDK
tara:strand:+ start:796 stop:1032 length:237 start_codon:yes stop_codon:yes gene_type:complete